MWCRKRWERSKSADGGMRSGFACILAPRAKSALSLTSFVSNGRLYRPYLQGDFCDSAFNDIFNFHTY